ncbi:MAG: thioredoxin domain-containing protein [Myxococcales bacterium]|nr:thioredoxin domain-containing protein [Myxococcales bacterium]
MKSFSLHALALFAASIVACRTGGGAPAGKASVAMEPGAKVAEVDGKTITYGDLAADKDVGPKVRQAEVKALTDLYDQRRGLLDEMISRRLLEDEAKSKGKTLEQWFQTDYVSSVPDPSEDEAKAFYEEHKAQMPQGQSFDDLKPRIKQAVKQQKLRENMGKMLDSLKEKHHVTVALEPPELPRIEVEAKGPARGPSSAPVTIVEFSDFQCPFCGREYPVIERLMKEYDGKVHLVFRHFPLDFHPFAEKAAEAGACAAEQGKFWELHNKMFENQQKLAVDDLKDYAKSVGVDPAKFDKCLDSGEKKAQIDDDQKAGAAAGVNGTPAFFINGIFVNGAQPYEQMKQTIDRELKKKG